MATSTHLRCIASTGDAFCKTIVECDTARPRRTGSVTHRPGSQSNAFVDAQFSADGTTIITRNEDQCLRTFGLPANLLEPESQPLHLTPHSTLPSPTNVRSYAILPRFDLQDPSTTVVLSASADVPISLTNALNHETVHAKYPLVNPTTEAFIAPHSLAWTRDGTHFVAGSKNQISVFDASCSGSGPIRSHGAAQRGLWKDEFLARYAMGCKGIVTALCISPDGILAMGTTERQVALYENEGSGQCVTAFDVGGSRGEHDPARGTGITSLRWSPCGKYLLVAERQSDGIHVYDMRNALQRVAQLIGRRADTTQRLGMDLVLTTHGYEVWAGGTDGCVRMWNNPGWKAGEYSPDEAIAMHDGRRLAVERLLLQY